MPSNNSKSRKVQLRAGALARFAIKADKFADPKDQAKYIERKENEQKALKKN